MKLAAGFGIDFLPETSAGSDEAAFYGYVHSNELAAFVADKLRHETTISELCDAIESTFGVPREKINHDVQLVISRMREMHAIAD